MPVLIEVKDLSYVHPQANQAALPALQDITFTIEEGELVALVGANGSGKTTLARHLNALLVPASGMGSVRIARLDTRQKSDYSTIRTTVGMVFQSPEDQIVGMTVEEDVAFGPENLGIAPAEIRRSPPIRDRRSLSAGPLVVAVRLRSERGRWYWPPSSSSSRSRERNSARDSAP